MVLMSNRPAPEPQKIAPAGAETQTSSHTGMATKVVIAAAALLTTGYLAAHNFSGKTPVSSSEMSAVQAPTQETPPATPAAVHAASQFAMIAPEKAAAALKHSSLTPSQQSTILAAVKRRDVRLVAMPLADATGQTGQTVTVSSAGITQTVVLSAKPKGVLLPIRDVGEVMIAPVTTPQADGMHIVALTALGPQMLPTLASTNQQLILDVIVQ